MSMNLNKTADRLRIALNQRGYNLTISKRQFLGNNNALINLYIVAQAVWDDERHKYYNSDLYSTSSRLKLVFYLRDLWYFENGWELPTDDEMWNETRKELQENGKYRQNLIRIQQSGAEN